MSTNSDWGDEIDLKDQTLAYFVRSLKTLWSLTKKEHRRILFATGLSLIVQVMTLLVLLVFSKFIGSLKTGGVVSDEQYLMVLVMLVLSVSAILITRRLQDPIFLWALISLENYWPCLAQEKLLSLSAHYHDRENTGRKIAKVSKGIEKLISAICAIFWDLLPALLLLVINVIFIFVINPMLAIIFFLPFIPAGWLALRTYGKFRSKWVKWEERKEESVGVFCQSVINCSSVQSFVQENTEAESHGKIRADMQKLDESVSIGMQKHYEKIDLIMEFAFYGTILVGLWFYEHGMGSVSAITYVFVTGNMSSKNLLRIIRVYTKLLRDLVSAERMHELLREVPDVANQAKGTVPQIEEAELSFKGVSFAYPGAPSKTINAMNFTISPGEMVAFVGKSGAGKSTIAKLLARVYDPTSGFVNVSGHNARSVDRDWYRKLFAFVHQEPDIFDGTIKMNVSYACPNASDEMVEEAIRAACFEDVLSDKSRFPKGLMTEVGERGTKLSGGEKQRVAIARAYIALLFGAKVLVLDEATSSLDSESESVVQAFISELRQKRNITIVAIAHRLSTISEADRIFVIDDGEIAEVGNHAGLVRKNGIYKKLVELQEMGAVQ